MRRGPAAEPRSAAEADRIKNDELGDFCYLEAMNLLVTGGAGFIGSHFVLRHKEQFPDDTVVVLDSLTSLLSPFASADAQ